MITIVGLDIGYGYTKAVALGDNGQLRTVIFPSVIGQSEQIRYKTDLVRNTNHHIHLEMDDGERFVGRLAQLQSRIRWSPQDRDRTRSSTMRTLAHAALSELGLVGVVTKARIVTGLPVEWFNDDKEELDRLLTCRHEIKRAGQVPAAVQVTACLVVPQPFGSFFKMLLDENGHLPRSHNALARGRIGVIDIGMHTTDYVTVDNLEYVEPGSGSTTTAMSKVYELLRHDIQDRHRMELDLHEIDRVLRTGEIEVFGRSQPIEELARHVLTSIAQEIISKSPWGEGRKLNRILITGGGAYALGHLLAARYPADHAIIIDDADLANVIGFYRYGLRKFR